MLFDGVGADADELHSSLCKFGLQLGEGAEFGGAAAQMPSVVVSSYSRIAGCALSLLHWCKVFWVGEQNNPLSMKSVNASEHDR